MLNIFFLQAMLPSVIAYHLTSSHRAVERITPLKEVSPELVAQVARIALETINPELSVLKIHTQF